MKESLRQRVESLLKRLFEKQHKISVNLKHSINEDDWECAAKQDAAYRSITEFISELQSTLNE